MDLRPASKSLDFSRIYAIGNAFKRGALHFDPVKGIEDPKKLLKGEMRPYEPIDFRRDSGSKPQDLMGATSVAFLLMSDRFTDALLEERVTGWGTYPVRLYDKAELELPGYYGLAVTGRAGPGDRNKTRIELQPPPVPQGQAMHAELGMYFEPESWDRSDIFIPEGTTAVCVVERVKQALEKRKLTNISFKPLTEFLWGYRSEHPGERASAR